MNLKNYGFDNYYLQQITTDNIKMGLVPGRIIEVHRELYKVVSDRGATNARLKGSIFYSGNNSIDYPTIGDYVLVLPNELGDDLICSVLTRKSYFSRLNPTPGVGEQVVAANFDYVFIMTSLNHDFNIGRLERYLTAAWQSGGTPVILLTKADLVSDYSSYVSQVSQIAPGVQIIPISSFTGVGLKELDQYLQPSKTIVFLGSSGIGKSSLVNALSENVIMPVNDVREDDSRGRHTTTHRQMIKLENGVLIIDTPGMRELGMWDVTEGLNEAFTDIKELSSQCKFRDCIHEKEPGCAIQKAITEGTLDIKRWKSYLKLKKEAMYSDNKQAHIRAKDTFGKKVSKDLKIKYKNKDYE